MVCFIFDLKDGLKIRGVTTWYQSVRCENLGLWRDFCLNGLHVSLLSLILAFMCMSIGIALTLIPRMILVMCSFDSGLFLRWLTTDQLFDSVVLDVLSSYRILIDYVRVCRMPPRRNRRNPIPDAHSEEVDNNH